MATLSIDGRKYLAMLRQGASDINENRQVVNDLNVFPIPDGDTGDNMHMTISAGCGSVAEDSLPVVSEKAAKGMLLGARGNSGVILSRIFAGISKGICSFGKDAISPEEFAEALICGVDESYKAVSNPVEGTILTVFKDAANCARDSKSADFEHLFASLLKEMEASLSRTPELLAVLKEAGVVDSGGAGLLCIMRGMAAALSSDSDMSAYASPSSAEQQSSEPASQGLNLDLFTADSVLEFGYCTEFILRLQSCKVNVDTFDAGAIREYLCSVGDSVVFFREGSIVKAHVHTKSPGDILNTCQQWGEFLSLKIENMTLQHHGTQVRNNFKFASRHKYAVVAVASGEGLKNMFKEAGASVVIDGGQTMNPSAASFIEAFDEADADTVFVFPNNSNIIMTAEQAASMYDKSEVIILPSKDVGQGYVAIASLDFSSASAAEMKESAEFAMASVITGMVSKASRNACKDSVEVAEGDYIGFCGSRILCDKHTAEQAALELCEAMDTASHDVALVLNGASSGSEEASALLRQLQDRYKTVEFIPYDAGQRVFDYIIVLC